MEFSKQFFQSRKFDTIVGSALEIWQNYSIFFAFSQKIDCCQDCLCKHTKAYRIISRYMSYIYLSIFSIYLQDSYIQISLVFTIIVSIPRADQQNNFQSVVKLQSQSVQLFYALRYEFEESFDKESLKLVNISLKVSI